METSGSDLPMIVDVVLHTKRQPSLGIFLFSWISVLSSTVDISGLHHYHYHHHTYLYAIRYLISSNIHVQLTLAGLIKQVLVF